jgi:hypothetical protein
LSTRVKSSGWDQSWDQRCRARPDEGGGSRNITKGPFVVDTDRDSNQTAATGPAAAGRLRSALKILIVDIAAPLATYYLLRKAGLTAVTALLLSGVFPAAGMIIGYIRHPRLDAVGALVLAGIIVGTVLGLVFRSARLQLLEGSVPTGIFGLGCLGSLWWASRPLMYRMALEFIGPDSDKGREMISLWQYERFRRINQNITAVWGVGFLLEAALRVVIVYNTSTGTALAISKVTPFVWAGVFSAWTVAYGTHQKKKGERQAAAATVAAEAPETAPGDGPATTAAEA